MDRIIIGIIGIPLGFVVMIYRYQLKQLTGNIGFAERYFGAGGTYNFFILLGIIISLFSLAYALGSIQDFLTGTFGHFFGVSQPLNPS